MEYIRIDNSPLWVFCALYLGLFSAILYGLFLIRGKARHGSSPENGSRFQSKLVGLYLVGASVYLLYFILSTPGFVGIALDNKGAELQFRHGLKEPVFLAWDEIELISTQDSFLRRHHFRRVHFVTSDGATYESIAMKTHFDRDRLQAIVKDLEKQLLLHKHK